MGLTFQNIQIYNSKKASVEEIVQKTKDFLYDLGYRIAEENEEITRSLKIHFDGSSDWVAVYDDSADFETPGKRKSYMKAFSEKVQSPVVSIHVEDSDALVLQFYNAADNKYDCIISGDNGVYFGPPKKSHMGKVSVWRPLMDRAEAEKEFKGLLEREYVFAEARLRDIGEILRFEHDAACAGFDDAQEDAITLHFTYRDGFVPDYRIVRNGKPVLKVLQGACEIVCGEPEICVFYNAGGISKGVAFILAGEAIEKGVFTFSKVEIEKYKDYTITECEYPEGYDSHHAEFEEIETPEGKRSLIAKFDNFELPEGVAVNRETGKADNARYARHFTVRFTAHCKTVQTAWAAYYMIPYENPKGGQTGGECRITSDFNMLKREHEAMLKELEEEYGTPMSDGEDEQLDIQIRQETEKDHEAVRELVRLAFLNVPFGDHDEHFLVERLRRSDAFIPELSLVAIHDEKIVGHILFTKMIIETQDESIESLSLAPLAVLPEYQCMGVGSALVTEGLRLARGMGYRSVIVVGHPHYYPRFGFMPAGEWGICAPFDVPGEAFMACELCEGALRGVKGTVLFPKEFGLDD